MSCLLRDITNEIIETLEMGRFTQPIDVEKNYLAEASLEDITGFKVQVRPSPTGSTEIRLNAGRSQRQWDMPFDVVLVTAIPRGDTVQIEQAIMVAEEIDQWLFEKLRTTRSGAAWAISSISAPYVEEDLRERGVIVVVNSIVFRALR